jgi:23S rRNA (pseudouridine1915-N3)-methyltransferase
MGDKMPDWVDNVVSDYQKRISLGFKVKLTQIPLTKRTKSNKQAKILDKECDTMVRAVDCNSYVIALEINGTSFSTEEMTNKFQAFQQLGTNITFLIGGPEGLHQNCINMAQEKWSLSKLTLPHPLARVILFESTYRCWTIINNHPYHK